MMDSQEVKGPVFAGRMVEPDPQKAPHMLTFEIDSCPNCGEIHWMISVLFAEHSEPKAHIDLQCGNCGNHFMFIEHELNDMPVLEGFA